MKCFPFVTDPVFRVKCIACVPAVNIGLSFGTDGNSVQFLVVAAAPTPFSPLEPSVYM